MQKLSERANANKLAYIKRYKKEKTINCCIQFNKEKDADCIEWLKKQDSMAGAIKKLIKAAAGK